MSGHSPQVSLVDQAYETLRTEILDCTLAPGSQVTERALAASHSMGLSAVRGALVRLTAENLVTAIPRVGYQVAPITLRGVSHFFEAWEIVGPPLLRLAAMRMSDDHRARIAALAMPGAHASPDDLIAYASHTWAIVVDAADNRVLADVYRRLAGELQRIFTLVWRSDTGTTVQVLDMSAVLSARPEEVEAQALSFIREYRARVTEWLLASTSIANQSVSFPF